MIRTPAHHILRRLLQAALLVSLLFAADTRGAAAQTRADSAAVLLATALRFADEGADDVAEALFDLILQRYGDTEAASRLATLRDTSPAFSRGGRAELQVWGTLYGAWLGVAVPLIASADEPEPYGIGLLLGAPAGFFASRAYARSRPISVGQARAITLGGTWGTWQGLGWAKVFDLGAETQDICLDPGICYEAETGDDTEEVVAAAVAGGIAGIVIGALISHKPISPGLATTVNFGALWGTAYGLAGGVIAADAKDDELLVWALLGGNAGLLTTAIFGPTWQLSRPRARLISLSGLIGAIGGFGIDLLAQPDDDAVIIGIPALTSLAGLAFGAWSTRNYDADRGRGGDGGAFGGALLQLENGEWQAGMPLPFPTTLRNERTGRPEAALHVPLLRARF